MKNIRKISSFVMACCLLSLVSCDRDDFADMNTDPDAILSIPPEYELTSGLLAINNNSFEYYYDYNRAIYYWAQTFVTATGNAANVYEGTGNLNNRNGNFYTNVGNKLTDVIQLIDRLPAADKARYVHLRAIARIPLAYYAWHNSDVNGSIAYTQGFKARYTIPALLTPEYDTQEALYDTLDTQLKNAVAVLKTAQTTTQVDLKTNDVYYGGDVTKWIKAANSLRLRIAFRLMKRKPARLKAIAEEVLADPVGVISSTAEDWSFLGGPDFARDGNYNPSSNSIVTGSKNMVDFMWQTKDPRIRIFYRPSSFTKERFDAAKAQGKIPATFAWDGQLYRGQFADPEATLNTANAVYFANITFNFNGAETSGRLPSNVQSRLFNGSFESGAGKTTFPIITYADICFMRAELAVRGITGTDAEGWYNKGIDASLTNYDVMGKNSALTDYVALTPAEVTAYKAQPGVKYDAANGLEQILVQQYLNFYKNQNEAWALIKRTGYPSVTGKILKLEKIFSGGNEEAMPRRFSISLPTMTDVNYTNVMKAIEEMQKDPGFGAPSDINGRVWWDMP